MSAGQVEQCDHGLRVFGARTIVRRRTEAGWPAAECKVPRGTHVACRRCLRTIDEIFDEVSS